MADHGISEAALETIRAVLATCDDEITQVDLFGSRAAGRHRRNSDIDLVVYGDVGDAAIDRLRTRFIESSLPVSVDIFSYERMTHRPLKAHVDLVTTRLFTAEEIDRRLDDSAIAGLKPYPQMKDSGVKWIGEVPAHWDIRRLKQVCSRSALYGANIPAESYADDGVRFLRTTDITDDGDLNAGGVFVREDLVHNHLLADGDLLLSRSGTIGRSMLYEREKYGICSYAGYLVRFVFNADAVPRYVFWFTKTRAFSDFLRVAAISSTIENLNGEKYANCPLPLPPISEQAAIAGFLDQAVRRIRRYVNAKRKLITLLEEQKQAMISQVVTGQIDVRTGTPYSAYKPHSNTSGSDLRTDGTLPTHWDVKRLRNVVDVRQSNVDKHSRENETQVRLCNYVDVYHNDRIDSRLPFMLATATTGEIQRFGLRSGDVLITKDSETWNDIGVPALVEDADPDVVCGYHLALLRPFAKRIHPGYLFYALQSTAVASQFHVHAGGVIRFGLTRSAIKAVRVPLPPLPEQAEIVSFLDRFIGDLDRATEAASRKLALAQELSARLVADAVTGKIDLRTLPKSRPWT